MTTFPYRPPAPDLSEQAAATLYVRDNPGCSALDVARAIHPPDTPPIRSFQAVKYLLHCTPPVLWSTYHPDDSHFRLYVHPDTAYQETTP